VCTLPLVHNPYALTQVWGTLWNVRTLSLITILTHYSCAHKTKTWCKWLTNLYVHLHLHLVPMAHHPICTITNGVRIGDITFPSPLFMHCPQCIIYKCIYKTSKIFKNMRILSHIASSHSQVAFLGPYEVHWSLTSSMTLFQSCLIF
jgi:hypothetical protein